VITDFDFTGGGRVPKVTKSSDGSTWTEYSSEETARSIRICGEVARRMGRGDPETDRDDPRPSIQHIAQVVAWTFAYAPEDSQMDESNRLWTQFHAHSEWLRARIVEKLSLPKKTGWEEIYRRAGFLVDSEYESEEKFWEAHHFGEMTRLEHPDAPRMLRELENIKFQNDGLI